MIDITRQSSNINHDFDRTLTLAPQSTSSLIKPTQEQMIQRLAILLVQVKAEKNSDNLFNEIREIVHPLYQRKQIK